MGIYLRVLAAGLVQAGEAGGSLDRILGQVAGVACSTVAPHAPSQSASAAIDTASTIIIVIII